MSDFYYRRAQVGQGFIILDGDSEVDWQPTREAASTRVDELEAKYGTEARKAETDALFRSMGINPDNLPSPSPEPGKSVQELAEDAAKELAEWYVAKHGTAAGLPPHLAKHVPEARLQAEREHPDIREVDIFGTDDTTGEDGEP